MSCCTTFRSPHPHQCSLFGCIPTQYCVRCSAAQLSEVLTHTMCDVSSHESHTMYHSMLASMNHTPCVTPCMCHSMYHTPCNTPCMYHSMYHTPCITLLVSHHVCCKPPHRCKQWRRSVQLSCLRGSGYCIFTITLILTYSEACVALLLSLCKC